MCQNLLVRLAAVPMQYQPEIILLLPKLLEPADHATAANLLIAHLAEATRLGPAAEALIRLPVLATLGLLTVDAGTAKKLLTAVLNVRIQTPLCISVSVTHHIHCGGNACVCCHFIHALQQVGFS